MLLDSSPFAGPTDGAADAAEQCTDAAGELVRHGMPDAAG